MSKLWTKPTSVLQNPETHWCWVWRVRGLPPSLRIGTRPDTCGFSLCLSGDTHLWEPNGVLLGESRRLWAVGRPGGRKEDGNFNCFVLYYGCCRPESLASFPVVALASNGASWYFSEGRYSHCLISSLTWFPPRRLPGLWSYRMEMKLITKMMSWVPWKIAKVIFLALFTIMARMTLWWPPPKVEANLALLPEVLRMAFHRASLCTLGRAHLIFFVYYVHHFLVIWSLWGLVTNTVL